MNCTTKTDANPYSNLQRQLNYFVPEETFKSQSSLEVEMRFILFAIVLAFVMVLSAASADPIPPIHPGRYYRPSLEGSKTKDVNVNKGCCN